MFQSFRNVKMLFEILKLNCLCLLSKKVSKYKLFATTVKARGWKKYRTTGPLVPEYFLSSQKIFPQERKKLQRGKGKLLEENSHHELRNTIINASILIVRQCINVLDYRMIQQMLHGKCIFSQSAAPDFQNFLGEHGSPRYCPQISSALF